MASNLEKHLALAHCGAITFRALVEATKSEYTSMACYLMRRWTPPMWMVPDDLVQELYFGTHLVLPKFDAKRGKTIGQFVVFNSMSRAKRALHKARGAKLSGCADKNPSHIDRPFASFGEEGEALVESLLADEPAAEQIMIAMQDRNEHVARALGACEDTHEEIAILAIAQGGDVHAGARVLYDDFRTRVSLRLGSEEHALRYVVRAASAVADRLDASDAS